MGLRGKSLAALFGIAASFLLTGQTALAATPYDNYIYDTKGEILDAPPAVVPTKVIMELGSSKTVLNGPQDLFVDDKGSLFVVDTGNNRILKLDKGFKVQKEYKHFDVDGKPDGFNNPNGVYVDSQENVYVADTDNARLVKLAPDGSLAAVYGKPQSKLLPADFDYKPTKVVCDTAGRIFIVSRGFNMGLIELDRNGGFVQMLGASKVTYSLTDMIWRMFSTKAQRERMAAFVPAEYNNVSIDKDNFVFVTTGSFDDNKVVSKGLDPVRMLNAQGTDVLRRTGNPGADVQWGGMTVKGPSFVVDVVNLDYGMYGIVDQKRGRVFVYNASGMMLFMFGGLGQTAGTLKSPVSLAYYNHEFIVLDSAKNALSVYAGTDYGNQLFLAEQYKNENDFEKEKEAWGNILALNENNPLALIEMGKVAYKQRDMVAAMDYFEKAEEQKEYSKAFQFYRRDMINQYLTIGGICLLLLILLLVSLRIFMKIYRKKHPKKENRSPVRYVFHVILRPLDGFWDLKYEKRGNVRVSFALMGLACLALIVNAQFTGFIFQPNPSEKTNFLVSIATVMAPVLLWIISTRCVTSLLDGEGSLKNIVTATGYALTPIVIVIPIATVISNFFTLQEGAVYHFFMAFALIWTGWLLFASVKQTHDYSLGKTVFIIVLSLLVIVIIIFIGLLCTALVQQIVAFVGDVSSELINR